MSVYQKHLDAYHRIFDSAHPSSRQAHERQRHADGKFHHEQPTHIAPDEHAVQDHGSGPAPGYDNDVGHAWTRGYGMRPGFDAGPSGRRFEKK